MVAYMSRFGTCFRTYCVPKHPNSPAQARMKAFFGFASSSFGLKITEDQRQRWVDAALSVPSHPSLSQYSHLSGQQFCVKINSTLQCVGQAPVSEPPQPVVFGPNPVGGLTITNDPQNGVRLLLAVGTASEDIMVFAQTPCSCGRMKHRRLCYIGLAGPATAGQCEITGPYIARFGQPAPGQKIFVMTNQEKNGWKGPDSVFSAIVPPPSLPAEQPNPAEPKSESAVPAAKPESQPALAKGVSSLSRTMYKGSTPGAQAKRTGLTRVHPLSIPCTPLVHGLRVAMAWLGGLGMSAPRAWRADSSYRPVPSH